MATYKVHFTVIGGGEFPIDMLRYDSCFPKTETDSNVLRHHDNLKEMRSVVLTHIGERHWKPTEGRWKSFGWRINRISAPEKFL